jgi:quercetin dioxygenase-like cupin family protein
MLTRRGFAGIATCWICATPVGFMATEASAQGAPPASPPGIKRKILSQMDGPAAGYVTVMAEVEIEPGVLIARHMHPGVESGYVVAGEIDLSVEGRPTIALKPGDGYQVPPYTPHAGTKNGPKLTKITATYVVEKDKPLASPA